MATQTVYLSGKAYWAKVFKVDDKYGKHSIEVELDLDSIKIFDELGLKNKPNQEGRVSFRRDPEGMVYKDKLQVRAGAPLILDHENQPTTKLIGNGSLVTIKVQVYDYDNKFGKGKGSRLESVRVDELVEYVKPDIAPTPTEGVKPRILF